MEIEILLAIMFAASNQINRNDSAEEIENDFVYSLPSAAELFHILSSIFFIVSNSSCSISFDNGILQFKLVYENWTRRPFCQPIIIKVTTTNTLSVYLNWHAFYHFYMCCAVFRKFISLSSSTDERTFDLYERNKHFCHNVHRNVRLASRRMNRNISIILLEMSSLRE